VLWEKLHKLPESILDYSGRFLYGTISSLKEKNYYLLGHHTGGDPLEETTTVRQDILAWGETSPEEPEVWKSPLKERVRLLKDSVAPRQVCWSNLYFNRGLVTGSIPWPVHKAVLDILKPSCIIAIGVSDPTPTYYLIKNWLKIYKADRHFPSGHGNWMCRVTEGRYQDKPLKLIGIPDLSRCSIQQHALDRVREECLLMDGRK
jgi:hypothetical protein